MDQKGAKIDRRTFKEVEVKHMDIAAPTGFNIVLAECPYLMEGYLKAFDPEATIEKYAEQLGADVKPPLMDQSPNRFRFKRMPNLSDRIATS